jgi:hypothetical protein
VRHDTAILLLDSLLLSGIYNHEAREIGPPDHSTMLRVGYLDINTYNPGTGDNSILLFTQIASCSAISCQEETRDAWPPPQSIA